MDYNTNGQALAVPPPKKFSVNAEIARATEGGIALDKLTIQCGLADTFGRRLAIAEFNGAECHRDLFVYDIAKLREEFCSKVIANIPVQIDFSWHWTPGGGDDTKLYEGVVAKKLSEASDAADELGEDYRPLDNFTLSELVEKYPTLASPVVDGLFRQGETANLISVSKVGKSWLAYNLAISIATGVPWLDRFSTTRGRVLLIDNELHRSTLAHRIPRVGEAMGFFQDDYASNLDIWPLRGNLRTLAELGREFDKIEPEHYQAIIFDAKYRLATEGVSENDNAAETQVYNMLDRFSEKLKAAMVLIHHSSKGNQSDRRVTDVGSGAGAQSRAADCHMVLREHEKDGVFVLDAAVRSFPPVESVALRWDFPLWRASEENPTQLRSKRSQQNERQAKNDDAGKLEITTVLLTGPATASKLRKATGFGPVRVARLITKLTKEGQIQSTEITSYGNKCDEYSLVEDTE